MGLITDELMNTRDFLYSESALETENVGREPPELPEEPTLRPSRFGSYSSSRQVKSQILN